MRIMKFCLFFALVYLNFTSLCLAQENFRLSPPIIEVSLGRGGTKVFYCELASDNKEKNSEFKIYPLDLDIDRDGAVEFIEPGKSKYSCSKWIQVEPKEVVLEPGKTKKIIVKLSLPGSISAGGYYSAIVCELVTKRPSKVESGSAITWRIAALLKVTVLGGKLEKKAELKDLFIRTLFEEEEKKNGLTFLASLENLGNIHLKAEGKLTVLTADRKRKGEIDFELGTGTVLPGHTRDFKTVYDKFLPEGDYIARAVFRYGGMKALEKELLFSVKAGGGGSKEENGVILSSLKVNPDELSLKIPAGGFRTAGFTIQNQKMDKVKISVSCDEKSEIKGWFKIEPRELEIEGAREGKVLVQINVPNEVSAGGYKTKINLSSSLITKDGQEEIEPQSIGVDLEIPRF